MGDAPPLWNVILKQLRQFFRSFFRHGISPGTEWNQNFPCPVESHITVHHGRNSDGTYGGQRHTVPRLHVLLKLCKTVLNTFPDVLQSIRPDTFHQPVLPVMASGGNWLLVLIHQHRLDPCRSQLYSQRRSAIYHVPAYFLLHRFFFFLKNTCHSFIPLHDSDTL